MPLRSNFEPGTSPLGDQAIEASGENALGARIVGIDRAGSAGAAAALRTAPAPVVAA